MLLRITTLFAMIALLWSCGTSKENTFHDKTKQDPQQQYLGHWRVQNDEGNFFYMTISPDGTASNTWDGGEKGKWEPLENKIILKWDDGWKDVLFTEGGAFKKLGYEPNRSLDETPSSEAKAERVEAIPNQP